MCLTSSLFENNSIVKHRGLLYGFRLLKTGFWSMYPYFPIMELTSVAL